MSARWPHALHLFFPEGGEEYINARLAFRGGSAPSLGGRTRIARSSYRGRWGEMTVEIPAYLPSGLATFIAFDLEAGIHGRRGFEERHLCGD